MAISRVKTSSILQGFPKSRSLLAGNAAFIPGDYDSIATAVGTGSSATITFNSIPSTYDHLQIRFTGKGTGSAEVDSKIRFNSDTGSNYAWHQVYGYNTSAAAAVGTSQTYAIGFYTTGTNDSDVMGVGIVDILDYKNTNKYKTIRTLSGMNGTNGFIGLRSGLWQNTNAINSIDIIIDSGNWATTTQIALYGIKGA
jgi:hypothetical protein